MAVAAGRGLRDAAAGARQAGEPFRPVGLGARLGAAVVAGAAVAYAVTRALTAPYYEQTLLAAGAAFLVVALAVCAAGDALPARGGPGGVRRSGAGVRRAATDPGRGEDGAASGQASGRARS
ncbi:hypothetical protein [Streptomyces sp. JJ36]|uniref:hypothetical protein n=1 Tax=Streptomyces sp. JJ36 TaxID=2736645 RepID=UPI001F42AADB|nr:hypothetical protein [Streptomyces sp. JJ36]MCF6525018.1 hypothetical protein [Streptomyces sp. JJ36]